MVNDGDSGSCGVAVVSFFPPKFPFFFGGRNVTFGGER